MNRREELLEWEREVSEAEGNGSLDPDSEDSEWLWLFLSALHVLG